MAAPLPRPRTKSAPSRRTRFLSRFPSNPGKTTLFVASVRLNPSRIIDSRNRFTSGTLGKRIPGSRNSAFRRGRINRFNR